MNGFERVSAAFEAAVEIFPADEGGGAGMGHNYPPEPIADPEHEESEGDRQRRQEAEEAEERPLEEKAGECVSLPLNDYGNGKRFSAYYGHDVLNVPRVGWFVWDGRHWEQDDDQLEVRRAAQRVSRQIEREVKFLALSPEEQLELEQGDQAREQLAELVAIPLRDRTPDQRKRVKELERMIEIANKTDKALRSKQRGHFAHAKAAGNTAAINNMMKEAQVDRYRHLDRLNADPLMINTENKVLVFRKEAHAATGKEGWILRVGDHHRGLYLTKMMSVAYDPEARCDVFLAFLESIMPDPELRAFIKRWFGYNLTGLTTEQKLCFFYGAGRNGKSTLVDLIAKMMRAYAASVPIETLAGSEQRKGSDATPDLVRLPGARMVRASEPEKGQKMKEALIKSMTGGEAILVRRMMQEFVEVTPVFKLTISGNYKPEIRGTDNGIWRRVLLIPFLVSISDEETDADLPRKLWAERSGILNWMLEGCREWLTDGLRVPESVTAATNEYRTENDPVGKFLAECCEITGDDADFTRAKELTEAFQWWFAEDGLGETWSARQVFRHFHDKTAFFKTAEGKSFSYGKRSFAGWRGIKLTDEFCRRREDARADVEYGVG